MILEGLHKSKLQDSVQLQTVLTLYDQETVRNNGQTSFLRLKTSVRLHIDQMMTTRNFRKSQTKLWKEEQSPRVKKERKPTLRGKWESVFSGRHMDKCSKGDSCSFSHDKTRTRRLVRWSETKRTNVFSRTKFEGQGWRRERNILKHIRQQGGKLFRQKEQDSAPIQKLSNPSCRNWHPPVCQNYKSETGCKFGRICFFWHVEADEKPSKKSKKGSAEGSVALLNESAQLDCASKILFRESLFCVKKGKLGSKHAVRLSKCTWHQIKTRERQGPSRGIIQKCEPHERRLCATKFGKRSHEDTFHQERCARRGAWDLANMNTSSRMRTKLRFTLLLKHG